VGVLYAYKGVHTLFTDQRERERVRKRERMRNARVQGCFMLARVHTPSLQDRGRERKREREKERKREREKEK